MTVMVGSVVMIQRMRVQMCGSRATEGVWKWGEKVRLANVRKKVFIALV